MSMSPRLGQQFILLLGPLYFGILFNWALLGVLGVQIYIYFTNKFKDPPGIIALVVVIVCLDMLQTGFTTQDIWQLVIIDWGDPTSLQIHQPWSTIALPIMSGIISATVQIFFAWRIHILKPGWIGRCVSIFIILTALMQSSGSIAFAIQWAIVGPVKGVHLIAGCSVWLAGSAACDVMITITMAHILHSAKMQTFERTDRMLDKLISRSIQSGAITSVFAIVELVLFITQSQNFLHISIALFLSKLYSNVLMVNLNARRRNGATVSDVNTDRTLTSSNSHLQTLRPIPAPEVDFKTGNYQVPI